MTYNSLLGSEYSERIRTTSCTLPKYKNDGVSWEWVIRHDPDYAEWCAENVENMDDELRDAINYGLDHLGPIR